MKHNVSSFFLLLFTTFLLSCNGQTGTNLTAEQFDAAVNGKEPVQLLDVRTPEEFNSGHIKNALLADWKNESEFNRRTSFIDKKKPVYVYCLAGGRSAAAAKKMRSSGYEKVFELTGGINAWKAAEKPVEGKSDKPQMELTDFNNVINSNKVVLVDFGAIWCAPCKKMEPVLAELQKKYADKFTLLKVDGGNDENLLKQFNVTALPVFLIFKDGKQIWRKEGIAEEKEIADILIR